MEYFKHFPKTEFSDNQCVNLTVRLRIKEYLKKNVYIYEQYALRDYERPDIIANTYYGNYKYTWVILYANDIFDPIRDWFLSYNEFYDYLDHKYQETPWKPSTTYYDGNKVLYGSSPYRCTGYHISDSPTPGFYLTSNQFKREFRTWESGYLVGHYAFFYNSLDKANGLWLKILNNDGVTMTVDGELPVGCDYIDTYNPTYWELYNNGIPRPGFEVAHQTIHEFRDSHDLVVDFQTWYYDVLADIVNEGNYYQPDLFDTGSKQIVRMMDFNENYYFVEMRKLLDPDTGKYYPYFYEEDITTHLSATAKTNLIQDFTVRTKNYGDPPEWVKESCRLTDDGWIDNISGEVVVPNTFLGKRTITKFQHEIDTNENKRHIKLIDKRYLPQILREFKTLLGSEY